MNYFEQISTALGRIFKQDTSNLSESELAQLAEDKANEVDTLANQNTTNVEDTSALDSIQDALDGLTGKFNTVEGEIANLKERVENLTTQVGEGSFNELLGEIKKVASTVRGMKVASTTSETTDTTVASINALVEKEEKTTETLDKGVLKVNLNEFANFLK